MKKILAMMLLALLVIFTGCDGGSSSSSSASDEEQAMAEGFAQQIATAMVSSTSGLVPPEGAESGVSRAGTATVSTSGVTINAAAQTFSGSITMDYDNVTYDDALIDGTLTYSLSGSWDDFGNVTAEGAFTGTLTISSGSESYTFVFAINMSQTGSSATVTGYITVNGAKATINETI